MGRSAGYSLRINSEITDLFKEYGKLNLYCENEILVSQGDYSESVFIIMEGEADVIRVDRFGNENHIATVGVGDIVGEMGAFLDNKRSATVRATSNLKVLKIPNQMFIKGLFSTSELTFRVIKNFAERISSLNNTVANHAQARVMLVLDRFIKRQLKDEGSVQQVELDMREINLETRLDQYKIIEGLYNLKALKAITKLVSPAEIVYVEDEGNNADNAVPDSVETEVGGASQDDADALVAEAEKNAKGVVDIVTTPSGKVICTIDVGRYNDTIRRISSF